MTPFSAKDIADHLRSAERLASQADRLAEHFEKQAEIHRERATRFRAEAAGWSQLAAQSSPDPVNPHAKEAVR